MDSNNNLSTLENVGSVVRPIGRVIATVILALILVVAFGLGSVLLILTLPYKGTVYLIAKLCHRDELDSFVSGLSCLFAVDDIYVNPRASLVNFCVLDGEIPLEKFRQLCSERVLELKRKDNRFVYSRLRQCWTKFGGYAFWKWDFKFDVRNHVRTYDYQDESLRLPAEGGCDEEDLRRIMSGLTSAPWARDRSPWEWLLIFNYRPGMMESKKTRMVFVIRRHHMLGDGYSSLQLTRHLFQAELPLAMPSMRETPGWMKVLAPLILPFKIPYDFAGNLMDSIDFGNVWHRPSDYVEYYTSFTGPVYVSKVKEIKRRYKVSFMAVIFAAACGGIKRIMEEAGQAVPANLVCVIPIPKPNHPGGMCNHMFLVFTKWPINIASPVERLKKIQGNIKALQTSTAPLALDMVLQACGLMPSFFMNVIASLMSCTLVSSIFPGSLTPVYFEGLEVSDHFSGGGTLRNPLGASIVIVGAYEKQRVVVNINKNVFPWPDLFIKLGSYIEEELEMLLKHEGVIK